MKIAMVIYCVSLSPLQERRNPVIIRIMNIFNNLLKSSEADNATHLYVYEN